MPPPLRYPPKPSRGDAVAVLSPSGRSAAQFPEPLDLGLARLRDDFGLRPVEYPTTRSAEASPAERARDVHAAFADPGIKAVLTTIGGGRRRAGAGRLVRSDRPKIVKRASAKAKPRSSLPGTTPMMPSSGHPRRTGEPLPGPARGGRGTHRGDHHPTHHPRGRRRARAA